MPETYLFGTVAYRGQVAGVEILSVTKNKTSEQARAENSAGYIEQVNQHAFMKSVTMEGLVKQSIENMECGGVLTIDGIPYSIDSISETKSSADYWRVSITASAPVPEPA